MDGVSLFTQINNAVLDLQGSQYQTYQKPLSTLARLLRHDDLVEANHELTKNLDLDAFLKNQGSHRGMGGSNFYWPEDPNEVLV